MAGELNKESFEAYVGRAFHLGGADRSMILHQIEAVAGAGAEGGARTPFTLIFRTPKSAPIAPEGLYACTIEGGPTHHLYIAPIHTPDPAAQDYQAAFN